MSLIPDFFTNNDGAMIWQDETLFHCRWLKPTAMKNSQPCGL